MTEREALRQLGIPPPDPGDPYSPEAIREFDEYIALNNEALSVSRAMPPHSERQPAFVVETFIDGQDSPETVTELVLGTIDRAVYLMVSEGVIRAGTVKPA